MVEGYGVLIILIDTICSYFIWAYDAVLVAKLQPITIPHVIKFSFTNNCLCHNFIGIGNHLEFSVGQCTGIVHCTLAHFTISLVRKIFLGITHKK